MDLHFMNLLVSVPRMSPTSYFAITSIQVIINQSGYKLYSYLFYHKGISVICYLLTGYAFTFGGGDNGFCGTQYFALIGLPEDKMAHCFFQYTFAATSTSIVKGIMHERCTTTAFICYTCLVSGFSSIPFLKIFTLFNVFL